MCILKQLVHQICIAVIKPVCDQNQLEVHELGLPLKLPILETTALFRI